MPAEILTFDAESHTYTLGRRQLVGVTTLLDWGGVKPSFRGGGSGRGQYLMDLGTAVHLACKLDAEGRLDESSVADVVAPYLAAFRAFCEASGFEPQVLELMVWSKLLGVAGTLDTLGWCPLLRNGAGTWLLDYKTGLKEAWHQCQTAAYAHLYGHREVKRGAVYLSDDGTFHLQRHEDPADFDGFLGAIGVANWRRKNKLTD
jgi:hypothetical protein